MSLVRVAWAFITASFMLTAMVALVVVLFLTRHDLADALRRDSAVQAADLALESRKPGATLATLIADAERRGDERGWMQVSIVDAQGRERLQHEAAAATAPAWFVRLADVGVEPASAVLGNANARLGTVTLLASGEHAYGLLWRLAWSLGLTFLMTGAVLVVVLARVVRWAAAPLAGFGEQVRALAEMRFVSMAEPGITEWVDLSRGLNVLVVRVQAMLAEREGRLKDMRDRAEQDALAGVSSRDAFIDHLKHALDKGTAGAAVIVRVHDLIGMNQRVGRERTDDFLEAVATTLRSRLYRVDSEATVLGRLNGADFGMLLPPVAPDQLTAWLDDVATALQSLHQQQIAESPYVAWIGASTLAADEAFSAVLTRVDSMVMASEMKRERFCLGTATQALERIAIAQWRVMIETALDTGRCEMAFFPVQSRAGTVHREGMLRLRGADEALLPASAFIPPAVRTGRIIDLDLRAIELAGVEIERSHGTVAVKVSPHSIRRPIFIERLRGIFKAAHFDSARLWIEVEEFGLAESPETMAELGALLREYRCRLGIAHFGRHFSALPELGAMAVDYVKLDARFCVGIAAERGKQTFARIAIQIAGALGIDVIAEGIRSADDLAVLEGMGIAGATGPWVSTALQQAAAGVRA